MASKPHIVMFPFMAQGHTIPLLDLSKALSLRGLKVTIIITPSNSSSIKSYIDSKRSNILLREISFPKVHGLPKGCENMSHIFSPDHILPFLNATKLLKEPFEEAIRDMCSLRNEDRPCCVMSDSFLGWTNASWRGFGIPRLVFHGMGVFAMAVKKSLSIYQTHVHEGLDWDGIIGNVKGVQLSFVLTTSDLQTPWGTWRVRFPGSFLKLRNLIWEAGVSLPTALLSWKKTTLVHWNRGMRTKRRRSVLVLCFYMNKF